MTGRGWAIRRWAACLAGMMSVALAGAQVPSEPAAPGPAEGAAAASAPAAAASAAGPAEPAPAGKLPRLVIDAPAELQTLLARYLDLARAIALPDAASVSDAEWSRLIAAAPAQAKSLVEPSGYFAAQASVRREPGPPPEVHLVLDPGPMARVGKLNLELQGDLQDAAERGDSNARALREMLITQWPLQAGQAFSNAAWGDAKNQVLSRLRAEGYAAASWTGTGAEVDPETLRVRLYLVVDSGPLFRAGEIKVEGLVFHDADRVRAIGGLAPGTPLTEARLMAYQDLLIKTGLFDQASVSLDSDPTQAAQATVLVRLRESPRFTSTLALGFSANTGPRASLEEVQRRLFGQPLTLRNKLLYGASEQSWDAELSTHPDADFRHWVLGLIDNRQTTDTDLVQSKRLRLGRSRDSHGLERLVFTETEHARECARTDGSNHDCANLNATSLNLHLTWRELDNAVLPTKGYSLLWQGGAGMASGSVTATGPYARLYGRATGYWPLGQSWYSEARLELGRVFARPGVQVPDSQRFRAGGDDSVRGYPYRTLAPLKANGSVTGGRMLFTGSVELARPISPNLPSVWWATFVDAGRAADDLADMKPALGYGLGLRWRSPVGPLRLDVARGQEVHRYRLHLSVGIAF